MLSSETAFNAETFSPIMTIETWLSKILELKVFYGRDVLLTFSDGFPIIVGRSVPVAEEAPVEAPVEAEGV